MVEKAVLILRSGSKSILKGCYSQLVLHFHIVGELMTDLSLQGETTLTSWGLFSQTFSLPNLHWYVYLVECPFKFTNEITNVDVNMNFCVNSPPLSVCFFSPSHSDHQQRQQQDELRRGRAARQSGLPGGGDREGAARHGGLHRQHALCLRKMGGSHPGRGQGQERRHRSGKALLHLRGESRDICETITGNYRTFIIYYNNYNIYIYI